jgi:hypothetical protein
MRRGVRPDPLALDESDVAWHQHCTFLTEPRTFVERLAGDRRFRTELRADGWGAAEWILLTEESDPCAFPLGRVTASPVGILLEAFSEARLAALRRAAGSLSAGALSPDETRAFPLATIRKNPRLLLRPLDATGEAWDAHDVARTWLRFVWPFVARADLGGRAPHALAATAKGRDTLAGLLEGLPDELARIPGFPRLTVETLESLILPPKRSPARIPSTQRRAPRGS